MGLLTERVGMGGVPLFVFFSGREESAYGSGILITEKCFDIFDNCVSSECQKNQIKRQALMMEALHISQVFFWLFTFKFEIIRVLSIRLILLLSNKCLLTIK